jgi:mono/diheme cytochrome c family protein
MWRTVTVVAALLLVAFQVSAQNTPTAPKPTQNNNLYAIPLDAAHKENPVKSTGESLARGKKQFGFDCAMCHGKNGDGSGDVAGDMKLKMHNQIDPATLGSRTDGELFYIIKNGKDQMPAEGNRVKDELVWDMVNYVRTFSKKGVVIPDKPTDAPTAEKPADTSSDKPAETSAQQKSPN